MLETYFMEPPRIKEVRKAKGITQTALAKAMGVSPGYLSMLESGQKALTPRRLLACATALDVNPSDLAPPHDAILDPTSGSDHFFLTVMDTFRNLSPANQEKLLSYGEFLLRSKQAATEDEE